MQKSYFSHHYGFLSQAIIGLLMFSIVLAGTWSTLPVKAASGQSSFALQPVFYDSANALTKSYFIFDSHPGTILQNQFRITNTGTATGTAALYTVDATTGQTSGAVYLSRNAVQRDVGTWITLDIQQITLAPGRSKIIPFQVTIPGLVRSGQHVGGIVAENMQTNSASQGNSLQITVQNLTIIAVQVDLPGPQLEQLAATGITPGGANNYQTLQLSLSNTGTVMLKPYGTLQIADDQKRLIQTIPLTLDTFLPATSINYPAYIRSQALDVGTYRATLDLWYGHGLHLHYTTTFTITRQQITQVFKSLPPLQLPGSITALQPWLILFFWLLLIGNTLYWGWKLYRFATASILKSKRKVIK